MQPFIWFFSFSWQHLLRALHATHAQSWVMAGWDCGQVSDSWQTVKAVDNDVSDSDNEPQFPNQRDIGIEKGRHYDRIPNSSNHTTE